MSASPAALDSELNLVVDDVLESDRDAFRKSLHVYGPLMRGFVDPQVQSLADVDQLAQDVLIVA